MSYKNILEYFLIKNIKKNNKETTKLNKVRLIIIKKDILYI